MLVLRRSFATTAPRLQQRWETQLTDILKDMPSRPNQVKRTNVQRYQLFYPEQILGANALSYEACARSGKNYRYTPVAPSPSIARSRDIFHQLNLDPRDFATNPAILSSFVTEMGKIKGREQTMLTVKNQRLLGRTIRRAKMMGVIPNLSKF